ncbi:MAG: recombinase family protein [Planctomycetaceae bacterium]|nr:recombinase family protein [Planctomycetaceae bacterium]
MPPQNTATTSSVELLQQRRSRRPHAHSTNSTRSEIAADYCRYSSPMQREETIESQRAKVDSAAARNGHQVASDHRYSDSAVSGTKLDREGLTEMLGAAERGEYGVLYLYSLSRLARESVITLPILKRLVHVYRVRVICVVEGIDTHRQGWEMISAIHAAVHERYIADLSANVLRGHEAAIANDYSVGDWCFGYSSQPVEGSNAGRRGRHAKPRMCYVINEAEAEWVRTIFRWFVVERRSIGWIVRSLNQAGVGKDHRATTPEWHHALVQRLLSNPKYIGVWPWGETKTIRDPETGRIRREDRSLDECKDYTRHRSDLALIPNEWFLLAYERLQANADKWEKHRRPDGTLTGSATANNGRSSNRLFSGLIRCSACGRPFQSIGRQMRCRGSRQGVCPATTSLPTKLAEQLVLDEIGRRMTGDDAWLEQTLSAFQQGYQDYLTRVPVAISAKERELNAINRKMRKLIDRLEGDDDEEVPELKERLDCRRSERNELQREIDALRRDSQSPPDEPTREWLIQCLSQLGSVLRDSTPAANHALKQLVGGVISADEITVPNRKSTYMRLRFTMHASGVRSTVGGRLSGDSDAPSSDEISLDIREPSNVDHQREEVKRLYDAGLLQAEIADQLGLHRSRVTLLLTEWFDSHGMAMPDGRARRASLDRGQRSPRKSEEVADRVMELHDQGLLLTEIADQVGINRDTVTAAIAHWHRSRGLPVPDGRTRRKSLSRKSR